MAFENLFTSTVNKSKKKKPFEGLFASKVQPSKPTSSFTGPTLQPRGEASKFLAPVGGIPIGENTWRTPSGSIWSYRPDGTRVIKLAAQFGGGSYEIDPKNPDKLIGSASDRQDKRDYAGVPTLTGDNRDHIIPVSLGGISDSKTNIRNVPANQNPKELETKLAEDVAAGRKTANQARLEIMTYKQNAFGNTPKTDIKSNLLTTTFGDISKGIGDIFGSKPKSKGMTFNVGENLSPEQKRQANLTLIQSQFSGLADRAFQQEIDPGKLNVTTKPNNPFLPVRGATEIAGLARVPLRAIVSITSPDKKLEPLEQKYPQAFRFLYGDAPIEGYSTKATGYEDNFKKRGFGSFSTPLAVIVATGEAALDLAPLYAPLLSSVNEELANVARTTGTKQIKFTYKDLQDISSATSDDVARLRVGQEKLDAFKAIGSELDKKNIGSNVVTKSEDTLLKQATRPFGEAAPATSYSVEGVAKTTPKPTAQLNGVTKNPFETKSIKTVEPKYNPFKAEVPVVVEKAPNPFKPSETLKTAPQEIKTPAITETTTKESPLIQEARKYKSAEEFVKAKKGDTVTIYHGSPEMPTKGNWRKGTMFADTEQNALYYASSHHKGKITVQKVEIPKDLVEKNRSNNIYNLKQEYPIEQSAQTKSQLTDIWKEAHDNLKDTPRPASKIAEIENTKAIKKDVKTPQTIESGDTPSKIAESVETKAIEQGLTKGYEGVAGYDKITIKEQAQKASDLFADTEKAMRVIKGEDKLPDGLRGTALITAAEEHIKKTGDARMAYELANSPLTSETSYAAQELRLAAEREPDSITAKLHELKKIREESVKKRYGSSTKAKKVVREGIKKELTKTVPKPKDWAAFIESIKC